jgi:hypothetical protein
MGGKFGRKQSENKLPESVDLTTNWRIFSSNSSPEVNENPNVYNSPK